MSSAFGSNHFKYFKNVGGAGQRASWPSFTTLPKAVRNVQRLPQIVFKTVKSGFASGYIGLAAQMNYVLGKASVVLDPSGRFDNAANLDKKDSASIASEWADSWKKSKRDGKHSMHLVASFPKGTDAKAVELIVRETCEEVLSQGRGRFDYIAAIHTDVDHPHGHILVNRRNAEGEWFYLARDHEFTNDRFKDSLVEHAAKYGIQLNNSSRLSRGIVDYDSYRQPTARSGLEGEIVAFGSAPFKHQKKNTESYFITLNTKFGERTLWGIGLAAIHERSEAAIGDTIRIKHEGKRPVTVKSASGLKFTAHRNDWRLTFNGEEFGSFDTPSAKEPTESEVATANRRSEIILVEAERLEKFSAFLQGNYKALSLALKVASQSLRAGEGTDIFQNFNEVIMDGFSITENDTALDSRRLEEMIATAKEQLEAVRNKIPELPEAERPYLEQSYFEAVGEMEQLLTGQLRQEFELRAAASIYAYQYRDNRESVTVDTLDRLLTEAGVSPEEFKARMKITDCSKALESYWIERDAQAIASQGGIDMRTQSGRDEAYEKVAQLHGTIIEVAFDLSDEIDVGNRDALDDVRRLSEQNALSVADSGQVVSQLHDLLGVSGAKQLQTGGSEALIALERAGFVKRPMESYDIAETYYEAMRVLGKDLVEAERSILVEREFAERARAVVYKIAHEKPVGADEDDLLISHVSAIVGTKGLERLFDADSGIFAEAGYEIEKEEAIRVLQHYANALRGQGINTDTFDKAIQMEREIIKTEVRLHTIELEREEADALRQQLSEDGDGLKL